MASVSGSNAAETNTSVPQWKKDLIQRRRQQNKGGFGNVGGGGAAPAAGGQVSSSVSNDVTNSSIKSNIESQCADASYLTGSELSREDKKLVQVNSTLVDEVNKSGAGTAHTYTNECELSECGTITGKGNIIPSVACNMRLEATERLCSTTEDTLKTLKNHNIGHNMEFGNDEGEHTNYSDNKRYHNDPTDTTGDSALRAIHISKSVIKKETSVSVYAECKKSQFDRFNKNVTTSDNNGKGTEDCESDSSEELQYGPGIVNKLKSKYLNLTLREMNKNRMAVQRFRRAASLEDLLDSNHDQDNEKSTRKFLKKCTPPGVAAKTERFRNLSRGNESMKRARSVETLMRYQQPDEEKYIGLNRLSGMRHEPVNDHIVLIDRTAVKIENKLINSERPKALNKPKKVKPLLAETERPPPDLVKTTMRLFESSVKKLKPKGEVAAKVATFKTINDTYKAQAMKKVIPKPPIQPKPAINGNSKLAPYNKKSSEVIKPTAELIEHPDEKYKNDGVATDPIVQSVSSVVYKFQQIEKSSSQSPSPEPIHNKLRSAPAASPEPSSTKAKINTDGCAKAVPIVLCPVANRKDTLPRSNVTSSQQLPMNALRETSCHAPISEAVEISSTNQAEIENTSEIEKITDSPRDEQSQESKSQLKRTEETKNLCSSNADEKNRQGHLSLEQDIEKQSKTPDINFDDASLSNELHSTRSMGNDQDPGRTTNGIEDDNSTELENNSLSSNFKASESFESSAQAICELKERNDVETEGDIKLQQTVHIPERKPIGAISSLGLMKASSPTNKEPSQLKQLKSETSPAQKQIGIIRPLVTTKAQISQQNLSNRELEKNLINRVKSIEQPTKVVVSLKSADEIQPVKIASFSGATTSEVSDGNSGSSGGGGGGGGCGGLWDTKPWNQQNNTMVFNFSNRKDVPDYIENDGLIIRRKRDKPKVGDGGIIVLDATIDSSTTDGNEWELAGGPPSPCDVTFTNDNILINGRSNLTKTPKNHKNRIQFNDEATRTFEYPSEASMLEDSSDLHNAHTSSEKSDDEDCQLGINNKSISTTGTSASPILGGGGLASYTPSKVDLASDGFELGITRSSTMHQHSLESDPQSKSGSSKVSIAKNEDNADDSPDTAAWGVEATADLLY